MATVENMDNRFVGSFEKENVMAFENLDNEPDAIGESPPPAKTGSRPFLAVAGILGAITLLALACIALYALFFLPQRRAQQANDRTCVVLRSHFFHSWPLRRGVYMADMKTAVL